MIVYITRHGQPAQWTQVQREDPEFPRGDPPLSALGREQTQCLGERLKALGFVGTIYSSPYWRTAETADTVAEVLDTVFYPEPALREVVTDARQMTNFEGSSQEELRRMCPHLAPDCPILSMVDARSRGCR